ncbi:hypothetical protein FHS09_003579 [Microbulbifer rhizosphaerae]|uniref:Uncharacterized protein n=1 Tax=Microbulbifer rhizosphaerae TaxID=1562603 RepID=A0A7W4WEF3_9GAMM|nr:hypothetical protein [Microbulbifer rhizosphaerae]
MSEPAQTGSLLLVTRSGRKRCGIQAGSLDVLINTGYNHDSQYKTQARAKLEAGRISGTFFHLAGFLLLFFFAKLVDQSRL